MVNIAGGAAGAASGAATGSAFGPIGTGIGAVGGGLLGLFSGGRKKPKKKSTLDKTQQALYKMYTDALMGKGGQFGDLFNFDADKARDIFQKMYADPAYQNFQENIIPGITGSFRGGNLQNSSYLGGALSKAGTDVQKSLDAQLANMIYQGQQDSVNRRISGINNILNLQTQAYVNPSGGAGDKVFDALLDVGGSAAGSWLNKKIGA